MSLANPHAEIDELLVMYSDTVACYGPDSKEARDIRQEYQDIEEFVEFADGLDHLKRSLGGSGIDTQPSAMSQ